MNLPSLEETDLKIVEFEPVDGESTLFYFLLTRSASDDFNAESFFEKMNTLLVKNPGEEALDDLFESHGIEEMLDEEEILELIENGEVDPEDLHASIHAYLLEEE